MRPALKWALVAVAIAAGLAIGGMAQRILDPWGAGGETAMGAPFTLSATTGEPITEAALRGQPTLLFFGFTHCPEVCPLTVSSVENWLAEIGADGEAVKVYFVTIDPERDTPEVLRDYLAYQGDRVTGISGPPKAVWDMARSFHVYWRKVDLGGGAYTMDHTSAIYMLDRNGAFAGTIAYGEAHDRGVAALRRLIDG